MYDNYLFVLIYGLFVCMYVRVQARSACHFYCVCEQRYYNLLRSSTYTKYVVVRSSGSNSSSCCCFCSSSTIRVVVYNVVLQNAANTTVSEAELVKTV